MTDTDPLLNQLHTEIDVAEGLRAKAKEVALNILDDDLEAALSIAEGDQSHPAHRVTAAMQLLAGKLGEELDDLTADAMRKGALMGRARVAAAKVGKK